MNDVENCQIAKWGQEHHVHFMVHGHFLIPCWFTGQHVVFWTVQCRFNGVFFCFVNTYLWNSECCLFITKCRFFSFFNNNITIIFIWPVTIQWRGVQKLFQLRDAAWGDPCLPFGSRTQFFSFWSCKSVRTVNLNKVLDLTNTFHIFKFFTQEIYLLYCTILLEFIAVYSHSHKHQLFFSFTIYFVKEKILYSIHI